MAEVRDRVEDLERRPQQPVLRPLPRRALRVALWRQKGLWPPGSNRRVVRAPLVLEPSPLARAGGAAVSPLDDVHRGEIRHARVGRRPAQILPHACERRLQVGVRVQQVTSNGGGDRVGEEALIPQPGRRRLSATAIEQRPIFGEEAQPPHHVPQHGRHAASWLAPLASHVEEAEIDAGSLGHYHHVESCERRSSQDDVRIGLQHHVRVECEHIHAQLDQPSHEQPLG